MTPSQLAAASVNIEFAGQHLQLLPGRALYWPAQQSLLVADVHLGKGGVFRRHGLAVPAGSTQYDLERLLELVAGLQANRLWVLGDFVHGAVDQDLEHQVGQWRERLSCAEVVLVVGNHDRHMPMPPARWKIDFVAEMTVADILLTHEPAQRVSTNASRNRIAGHLHPALMMQGHGRDRLRMPIFWQQPTQLVMPAFGRFTGGKTVQLATEDRAYLAGPDAVLPWR